MATTSLFTMLDLLLMRSSTSMLDTVYQETVFCLIFFFAGHSLQGARADYAPEKMRLDNEEHQEMILEPRSFIPHAPSNSKQKVIQPVTSANEVKVLTTNQPNGQHDGSGTGEYGEEEEIVKDDEGSSANSGEEQISLDTHKANSQSQDKALSAPSLIAEPVKGYSFHSVLNKEPIAIQDQAMASLVNYHENSVSADQASYSKLGNSISEVNKEPISDRSAQGTAVEDKMSGKNTTSVFQPKDSAELRFLNGVHDENGGSQGNIGDSLKFGVKSAKLETQGEGFPEDKNFHENNESGSGIYDEKTASSGHEVDGEEPAENNNDKNVEPKDHEDVKHSDKIDSKIKDYQDDEDNEDREENEVEYDKEDDKDNKGNNEVKDEKKDNEDDDDKENKDDKEEEDNKEDRDDEDDKEDKDDEDDKEDKDDVDGDNSHDKEEDDHDDMSGSGNFPTGQTKNKNTNLGSTAPTSQDKDVNNIDNAKAQDDESEDENNKENKMEDALNNDDVNDDEDEEEEHDSQLENKEQKELQTGKGSENLVEAENPTQQNNTNQQTLQQNIVHKVSNKIDDRKTQNVSKASPFQPFKKQIHQQSAVHEAIRVEKLENGNSKTRKISNHLSALQSSVYTGEILKDGKTLRTKKTKSSNKKIENAPKVAKVTHHAADVNHRPVKHNDKSKKKPRKVKSLLKFIHRSRLNEHGKGKHKTKHQKCTSDDVKTGYSLKGGTRAGHVEDLGGTSNMHKCIQRCCHKKVCDVALLLDDRCFGVACYSKELCKPILVPHPHYVNSQIAFMNRAQRRNEVEGAARPEFDCKYGELTIRNNHRWSGELCGGIVTCRNGIVTVKKCPGIPSKPKGCANPKLLVKHRPGKCCIRKWTCKDKSCQFGGRRIPHGVSLSDQLCIGVIKCTNGHLHTKECPKIPEKPTTCAHPNLKIKTIPGKCCQKRWICPDKSCTYGKLKIDDGERLTDASCAVVMECKNGFLNFKQCPNPPAVPSACLNPTLKVKRILGECCNMKWRCAQETK